ncbi:MAG: Ig-like domain repeat protein, partial [Frankiales bacterium]|nr:Ig-like domain repeat protein [Frankiales bacterium]
MGVMRGRGRGFAAALALGAVFALPVPALAANIVGNSDFESSLNAFQQGTSVAGDTVRLSPGNWQPWASVNNRDTGYPTRVATPHSGSVGGEYFTTTNAGGGNNSFFLQDLPDSFAPNQGYAIDAWIYPKAGTTEISIFFHWDRDAGNRSDATEIVVNADRVLWSAFGAAGSAAGVSYNDWHHLRLVGHGGTRMVELYVDDVRVVSAFGGRDYDLTDTNGSLPDFPLVIGNTDGQGSSSNRAVVDDVTVEQLAPDDTVAPTITGVQIPPDELFNANTARAFARVSDAVGVTKVAWEYSTDGGDAWHEFHTATYAPIQSGDAETNLSGLPDGVSKVRAIAYDAAGNASLPSAALDANADSTPPEIAVTCDEGTCAGWFTSAPVSVNATVTDDNPTSFTYTTDTNPTPQTPLGPISISRTTHFTFQATDGAGNQTVVDVPVQIDTTAPLVSISFRDAHNAYAQPSTDVRWPTVPTLWFNPRTGGDITVDAQAIDPESADGSTATFTNFDAAIWSATLLSPLSEQIAFGADSNTPTSPASVGIRNAADFDAIHPVQYIARSDSSPPSGPTISCDDSACSNPNGPVIVRYAATDSGSGIGHVWYTTDGSDPGPTNGTEGDTVTMEQPGTVRFVSADNVGNTTDILGISVEQASPPDTTPPDTTIDSAPDGATATPVFTFSSTEDVSTFECRLDGGAWSECASPRAYAGLAPGSHVFEVRATDAAGNVDLTPARAPFTMVDGTVQRGPQFVVGSADDHDDGFCTLVDCTFREAINAANTFDGSASI